MSDQLQEDQDSTESAVARLLNSFIEKPAFDWVLAFKLLRVAFLASCWRQHENLRT